MPARKMKEYGIVHSGDTKTMGIGAMTDARWADFFKMVSGQGLYPPIWITRRPIRCDFIDKGYGLERRTDPMLTLAGIGKSYPNGLVAVDRVDLTIATDPSPASSGRPAAERARCCG